MDKPWLANYPAGVPEYVSTDQFASLAAMLEHSCKRFADKPAFSNMGLTLTFAQLEERSRAFAGYLQGELGLARGERIAIMMPNLMQYPIVLFGALRAGLTVVNTNPLYTERELEHQLNDSGATTIVIVENFAHVLADCIERTPIKNVVLTQMGDLLNFPKSLLVNFVVKHVKKLVPAYSLDSTTNIRDALLRGAALGFSPVELTHDDIAFLQYTGGTTGVSKGAMLTHGNVVANVQQSAAWLDPFIDEGVEIVVTALPLYHIFALTANCMTFMHYGGHNVLITNPRDMPGFVKEISPLGFTVITGVNTLFNGLLNTPGIEHVDFSRLKVSLGGGMAVQRAVAERWQATSGCALLEAYGLTETSPAVTINPLNLKEFNASIGLPLPSTQCCVRDDAGQILGLGEVGELCVRGPQVMKGYWQRPEETRKVLDDEGWLSTGDVAQIDAEGFVRIVDRKKDMILVSGFNVYPNEVEDVIASDPGVLEVGVIGLPDPNSGERVLAVVVKKDPGVTEESILAHCRENLTNYKRPRKVLFVTELPKSNVGKILRRELRDLYADSANVMGGGSAAC
ncbi:MAG: long-chain acyl-CoA synthetase [Gammaproteobacteria bacterium]|jgi:long-chain acyl-CoA synthetase